MDLAVLRSAQRIPPWADWVGALVAAVVIFNVNVTSAGDPLSGVGLSAGPTSPGITEGARATFYGSLVIGGAVLVGAGLVGAVSQPAWRGVAALTIRTYGLLALAGLGGLLLDYRDGPVRTVQLLVYVSLFLGIIRFVRISVVVSGSVDANQRGSTQVISPTEH